MIKHLAGQETLFSESLVVVKKPWEKDLEEHGYIKDKNCTPDAPVRFGKSEEIYGKGTCIMPKVPGREDTEHFRKIKLDALLPLEDYDKIIVLISGGKDSIASYLKLREMGVPKSKIELWHHDIDGGHPTRRMDWKCTQNYMKAFAEAEGVPLRISYRVGGFFGELYRIGSSEPIEWIEPETGEVKRCRVSQKYLACEEIKKQANEEAEELLKEHGYRHKFPAKSPDLSRRWCSAYLKIMVADSVTVNLEQTDTSCKILIVSGERRAESNGRSKYNEMEIHRTNAPTKKRRIVHQWRPIIDYNEKEVWETLRRHNVSSHPCYRAGWNRCSCCCCIFSTPTLFAGIKELYPDIYEELRQDEIRLGFTIDNKADLDTFCKGAKSCVCWDDKEAIHSLLTGEFSADQIYTKHWKYPAGAFHGADGGSC